MSGKSNLANINTSCPQRLTSQTNKYGSNAHVTNDSFTFDSWTISSRKSNILQSMCTCSLIASNKTSHRVPQTTKETPSLSSFPVDQANLDQQLPCSSLSQPVLCPVCQYRNQLTQLTSLPDMVFYNNFLKLQHKDGATIEFNALDALKLVDETKDPLRVAVADEWESAREGCPWVKRVIKPFDWTFTTQYKGTLSGKCNNSNPTQEQSFKVEDTDERINIDKLKVRDEILFYDDVPLFEDELADHGTAEYSVKVRVMPKCLFVLARYYLRIDNALARINDTRLYYERSSKYFLREFTNRESKLENLNLTIATLTNPNELSQHLPTVFTKYEKLVML